MYTTKQTDLLILGAGPVGLTAAHALSERNLDYVLLESAPRAHTHSYALTLHPETMELMESLGVADSILKRARRLKSVALYSGSQRKATLDYSNLKVRYPFLTVVGQAELENILIEALYRKGKKAQWFHRARYVEENKDRLTVTVDRLNHGTNGYTVPSAGLESDKLLEYQTRYLIGADGYESTARRAAGINFPEIAPPKYYAMFEFKTSADLPDEMRLIIDNGQTHIFWPMSNGYCRWSFEVTEGESPFESSGRTHLLTQSKIPGFPLLNKDHLKKLLDEHATWFKGSIEHMPWKMIVKFEKRLATSFGHDRIWLAGDAAHISTPAGVLSMNVGMHEAYDLAERLAISSHDSERQAALASYNQERQAEWKQLLDLEHALNTSHCTDAWLRANKQALVGNIPATGESLRALLTQIEMDLAA